MVVKKGEGGVRGEAIIMTKAEHEKKAVLIRCQEQRKAGKEDDREQCL